METDDGNSRVWPVTILVAVCAFGLAWFGSTAILKHGNSGNGSAGQQTVLESLDARLSAAEQKWNAGLKERVIVADRISQIEKSANSNVRRARTEASALIEGFKRETSRNFEGVQSRLAGIESTQLEMHAEVARLREELASMRQELDAMQQANAANQN
jgi:hypothetical protein